MAVENGHATEVQILRAVQTRINMLNEVNNAQGFARLFLYNYLNLGIHLNAVIVLVFLNNPLVPHEELINFSTIDGSLNDCNRNCHCLPFSILTG